ncbi:MAG: sigma 54-interacting transcriptional regulator [Planctomycetota bacterium]
MNEDLLEILNLLSRLGDHKRYRTQLLGKLLTLFKSGLSAERAFLLTLTESQEYQVWCSQSSGGALVANAAGNISHHALLMASKSGSAKTFENTHQDRRFRTLAEEESGNKVRWIRVFPLRAPMSTTFVYLDSRFAQEDHKEELAPLEEGILELLRLILQEANLPLSIPVSAQQHEVVEDTDSVSAETCNLTVEDPVQFGSFVTRSPALISEVGELGKITATDIPILISGESGTGKELLAQMVHQQSGREGDFITLHCGTINESLAEVELFGHEKGAFTDAVEERSGLLELASGGTLFLDAIEESPAFLQAMLLRVLQAGRYRRVAGEVDREVDVRIIATMGTEIPEDQIRDDLIYRLSGFRIHLPPLRERPEDVLLILDHLLEAEKSSAVISPEIQALLLTQTWPGNGWQIRHLVQHMVAKGDMEISEETLATVLDVEKAPRTSKAPVGDLLGMAERELILRALEETGGNKTEACQKLGISRRTLYRRLEKHGLLQEENGES